MRVRAWTLLLATGAAALASAHEPRPSRYTWWGDVRPILERHCHSCHSPGGAGPMSLVRYQDVLPWAAGIRREVLERRMPPWSPEEGHLRYRGERLLSAVEIDVLADWTSGATPEGDAPAVPPIAERAAGGGLAGELLSLAPDPVRLGPEQSVGSLCRVIGVPDGGDGWLTGIELRSNAPRTLRRAVLWKGGECSNERAPLMVWVPGQPALELPADSGDPLEPGQRLSLLLEYRKTWDDDGLTVEDASELRLRLGAAPARVPERRPTDGDPLKSAAELVALTAVSADGERLEVIAEAPDGTSQVLLELRRPQPLWLSRYELEEPLRLAPGTTLRSRGGRAFAELLPLP